MHNSACAPFVPFANSPRLSNNYRSRMRGAKG